MSAPIRERTPAELERLRSLPSVESVLSSEAGARLIQEFGRPAVTAQIRASLQRLREEGGEWNAEDLERELHTELTRSTAPSIRPRINGTGVLIHTNMGRAPVSPAIWAETGRIMSGYSNVELDQAGQRGSRHDHLTEICRSLFDAPAALLVNNNAAAVMLVLAALAENREVVVSRGQLVEIGGSFRIPDVIEQGGAILREVGTTNKTRIDDYERAVGLETGALLSVHQSNFRIVGFSESVSDSDLARLAAARDIPLVIDEGSGRVAPLETWGLESAPTLRELVATGAVVTCSTDKLIGATQGGLILGSKELLARCAHHPLMRALRPGKESIALISATLSAFARNRHVDEIPLYAMLEASITSLENRAGRIAEKSGSGASIVASRAKLGGGTTPEETIESRAVELSGDPNALDAELTSRGVIGRIENDAFLLDIRTVQPSEDAKLAEIVRDVTGSKA